MTINEVVHRPQHIQDLRKVMIHFNNKKDEENGFYELMTSGKPINTFDNGRYWVNAIQRRILERNGIHYELDD
jgi:hypothetical protein